MPLPGFLNTTSKLTNFMEQGPLWKDNTLLPHLLKYLTFYATWRLTGMFTRAHYWHLAWARWIQFSLYNPISWKSVSKLCCLVYLFFFMHSLTFMFVHQNPVQSHECYMTCPFCDWEQLQLGFLYWRWMKMEAKPASERSCFNNKNRQWTKFNKK